MRAPLIVLKFGGSVLDGERALRRAVDEIYRWRRDGWQVVAVVSALAGRTGELLAESARLSGRGDDLGPSGSTATALLIAQGELECAARLGLCCERAGVGARVLSPAELGLFAAGPPLDATPTRLQAERGLSRALERYGVAIAPGFVGLDDGDGDDDGGVRLLGRGGSDSTALFLSERLGARCRLVKDVDGLYEFDPRRTSVRPPRRYASVGWDEALALGGSILQAQALELAKRHATSFEVACLNAVRATQVGAGPSILEPRPAASAPCRRSRALAGRRRLSVALLGLGTVGAGVAERLRDHADAFEIVAACARDLDRARERVPWLASRLTSSASSAAGCGADVVVEMLGGVDVARAAVATALAGGARVVSANKRLLAESDATLEPPSGAGRILASAAAGGSMPILERSRAHGSRLRRVTALLNGTSNCVLSAASANVDLAALTAWARALGLAEADCTRDLDGRDAADKLCLLARASGAVLAPEDVRRETIDEGVLRARARHGRLRQVAHLDLTRRQRPRASVELEDLALAAGSRAELRPLAAAEGVDSVAVLELADGTLEVLRGQGAGRWPTAQAVLADLLEISREVSSGPGAQGAQGAHGAQGARQLVP